MARRGVTRGCSAADAERQAHRRALGGGGVARCGDEAIVAARQRPTVNAAREAEPVSARVTADRERSAHGHESGAPLAGAPLYATEAALGAANRPLNRERDPRGLQEREADGGARLRAMPRARAHAWPGAGREERRRRRLEPREDPRGGCDGG